MNVDGIVFLIDTTDHKRFDDVRRELSELLTTPQLQHKPFLILGNKIDAKQAVSEQQLKEVASHPDFSFHTLLFIISSA